MPARPTPDDSASIEIAAPPQRIWDVVVDIARMGRLSPECTGGRWLDGATGPAVGARFKGSNKRGWARWSTTNTVVVADEPTEFAFETKDSGTRWRYRIDANGASSTVTESREEFLDRPLLARIYARVALGGAESHDDEMRAGLRATLERLKAVVEGG